MNCIYYCLYCYHKEKELEKSICFWNLLTWGFRDSGTHTQSSVKKDFCCPWASFRSLLHCHPPFISSVFQRNWLRFANTKILVSPKHHHVPAKNIEVTHFERSNTKALWGQMMLSYFLHTFVYACTYNLSSWIIIGPVPFPSPSTTSHSKTTYCRTASETAKGKHCPLRLGRTVLIPIIHHFLQQFSEGSIRSLNPTFSAVIHGQKDYTQWRNKEEMNANSMYNNNKKQHTEVSD